MTIAPITRTFTVKAPPERAFTLFAERMHDWWPRAHSLGTGTRAAIVMEPHADGRWFELNEEGDEKMWGKVLAWQPPLRLLLGWQLNHEWVYDPELVTEVELVFAPEGTGTRVTFEHRNLERYGVYAETVAGELGGGWPGIIDLYAGLANG